MRVNEQGRSMIEMLGVLAIVGVLSVGGIAGYSKAMAKFKANKVIDQVTMISTNIRTLYSSQKTYKDLDNSLARATNSIPAEMFEDGSGSEITNGFGGQVVITSAYHLGKEDRAYIIAFDNIPQAACVTMATTDWGGDAGSGFDFMAVVPNTTASALATSAVGTSSADAVASTVATAAGRYAIPGDIDNPSPMEVSTATVACANKVNNAFIWKYI